MKNQLPKLTPKSDSWEKILEKSEFETQLENHLDHLPEFIPNEKSWKRITEEMDRRTTIPLWIKWSVAASVVGFLLVAGLSMNESFNKGKITNEKTLTNLSQDSDLEKTFQELKTQEQTALNLPEETAIASTFESFLPIKKAPRENEVIESPEINLPEMKINHVKNISLSLPEVKMIEPSQPKTQHQVSISWSKIKPGFQVKTPYGRNAVNPITQTQASTDPPQHLTIEINN